MKEQDLLEEIGKVSEELIAAHALPDAKRYGEGGAEPSVTAKEQIVMSEKKNEYIKNPFIRMLPAIAAVAAVLVAGVIILPKPASCGHRQRASRHPRSPKHPITG